MRGRKPGQGNFTGGRPEGSPNKKGSMEHEVYFRCGDELFEALSLAAVAVCEESVNLYVRKFLESAHIEHIHSGPPHADESRQLLREGYYDVLPKLQVSECVIQ